MPRRLLRWMSLSTGLVACPVAAHAQSDGTPLEYGRQRRIASAVLGETRTVDVALPAGYDQNPDRRYPLLVVLDGESQHQVAAAMVRFQAAAGQLPAMIVAGVRNTDRNRDLSPPLAPGFPPPQGLGATFGGGDRFLAFLAQELLPLLDRDYRTAPLRVLVGHSIGGTFALHTLARQPGLFTGYIVMEPAGWWNDGREHDAAREMLRRPEARRARVVLVNALMLSHDTTSWGGSAPLVRHRTVNGETHVSMPAAGLLQALQAMFADFRATEWRPGTRPIAMIEHLDSLAERVGWAVPVPARSYMLATRMSLDGRFFDDAQRALDRWEAALGVTDETRGYRERLARERAEPTPPQFIPLEIPARRPTPRQAAPYLGRWRMIAEQGMHELDIRAAGDTIVVHSRQQFETGGQLFEGPWPVIQVTADGTLEIGAPYLRGIAGLVIFRCRIAADGTLDVTREIRGYARTRGDVGDLISPRRYRRL